MFVSKFCQFHLNEKNLSVFVKTPLKETKRPATSWESETNTNGWNRESKTKACSSGRDHPPPTTQQAPGAFQRRHCEEMATILRRQDTPVKVTREQCSHAAGKSSRPRSHKHEAKKDWLDSEIPAGGDRSRQGCSGNAKPSDSTPGTRPRHVASVAQETHSGVCTGHSHSSQTLRTSPTTAARGASLSSQSG